MNFMRTTQLTLAVVAMFVLAPFGCKRVDSPSGAAASGGHVHTAPHGGTLVEIGNHAYNLELVRDRTTGTLTAYVLDGHAENFVRIAAPSFELTAFVRGERRVLTLVAVANSATGETVGNTSQFEAQADWLKSTAEFPGQIDILDIRGTTFRGIALYLRK